MKEYVALSHSCRCLLQVNWDVDFLYSCYVHVRLMHDLDFPQTTCQ